MGERLQPVDAKRVRPLTIDQVDWRLFSLDKSVRKRLRKWRFANPRWPDFYQQGMRLLDERKLWGSPPDITVDRRTKRWLSENRPTGFFFEPDDLNKLLEGQGQLVLEKRQLGELLIWKISFAEGSRLTRRAGGVSASSFVLTRPNFRGDDNELRCQRSHFCPYLEVYYSADYQDGEVVFRPRLNRDVLSSHNSEEIERRLIGLLGIKLVTFPARLNFAVVDPDSHKIRVAMEAQNARTTPTSPS